MRYLAVIQTEFLKEARKWDDLSYEEQKGYLSRHPRTKRRLTARPKGAVKRDLDENVKEDKEAQEATTRANKLKTSDAHHDAYKIHHQLYGHYHSKYDDAAPDREDILNKTNHHDNMQNYHWDQYMKLRSNESVDDLRGGDTDVKLHETKQVESNTPKLDSKLGNLFDVYSSAGKDKYKEESTDAKKLNKIWQKEFPGESHHDAIDLIHEIERHAGLVARTRRFKSTRRKPLSKDEFIQIAKDVLISNDGKLPKVEGEEDPNREIMEKYKLPEPLLSNEIIELKRIENELPGDQKQFAKYLIPHSRREMHEKRSIEDASGDRPIIKNEFNHPNFGQMIRYDVPTSTRFSAPRGTNMGVGGLEFATFDSVVDAKDYIKKAPELEKKAKLRAEIKRVADNIHKSYSDSMGDIADSAAATDLLRISPQTCMYLAQAFEKFPREDVYGQRIDAQGKSSKYLYKKGRKFNLTPEQHKNIANALGGPSGLSVDNLKKAVADFDAFVKDVKSNKDILIGYQQEEVESFLKYEDKIKSVLEKTVPKVELINKLMDQHGYEKSKEDLKLPEGFKFKDRATIGEQWADHFVVSDDDDTMEMILSLGKPGEYGKYGGEIYYRVPGKGGIYSLGARGTDVGLSVDWNDDRPFAEVIKDTAEKVKQKQDKIGRSLDVPVAGGVWKVTPEGIEQIKKDLRMGRSHTFAPHGMGIGYHVSMNKTQYSNRADKRTEDALGISPLYIEQYDHD